MGSRELTPERLAIMVRGTIEILTLMLLLVVVIIRATTVGVSCAINTTTEHSRCSR